MQTETEILYEVFQETWSPDGSTSCTRFLGLEESREEAEAVIAETENHLFKRRPEEYYNTGFEIAPVEGHGYGVCRICHITPASGLWRGVMWNDASRRKMPYKGRICEQCEDTHMVSGEWIPWKGHPANF